MSYLFQDPDLPKKRVANELFEDDFIAQEYNNLTPAKKKEIDAVYQQGYGVERTGRLCNVSNFMVTRTIRDLHGKLRAKKRQVRTKDERI